MDTSIIVAIISGVATVSVGAFAALKKKDKDGNSVEPVRTEPFIHTGQTSDSNVAIGSNITQNYQREVHHHYGSSVAPKGSFPGKVASTPSLLDIVDAIRNGSLAPYDRIQVENNYVGLVASWPVTFCSLSQRGDGMWYVLLDPVERIYDYIYVGVTVDIEMYPKLKVMKSGHRCWVEGRIKSASSQGVDLELGADICCE